MDYPKTRKEAQASGAKFYFTGEPCIRGHISPRRTKGTCVACQKEDDLRDREKRKTYFDTYNKSEAGKATRRKYYEKNKEEVKARAEARPHEVKAKYRKAWKENNKDYVRADTKNRRRKHRQATPKWLDAGQRRQLRDIYHLAIKMTRATGVQHEVDHIIPLRSEVVCGLHVPWNLQVIPRDENRQKSNFHDNTVWIIYTPENPWRPLCP